jgi:hypothetical protein
MQLRGGGWGLIWIMFAGYGLVIQAARAATVG